MSIAQNYEHICLRIHEAAQKSGRRFEDITIVTVTKTVEPDGMREAFEAGATDFAENRRCRQCCVDLCFNAESYPHSLTSF